jgi:hypothetical protein
MKPHYKGLDEVQAIEEVLTELFGAGYQELIHLAAADVVTWLMFDYWIGVEEL